MDFVDITDSAFSLGNSASNEIINTTNNILNVSNEIISSPINLVADTIPDVFTNIIPDVIPDIGPDIVPNVIPDIGLNVNSLHIDDDNSIFIYIGIGVLFVLAGVFAFNYYNKNKRVRFNESSNEVCYPDSNVTHNCRRSEF